MKKHVESWRHGNIELGHSQPARVTNSEPSAWVWRSVRRWRGEMGEARRVLDDWELRLRPPKTQAIALWTAPAREGESKARAGMGSTRETTRELAEPSTQGKTILVAKKLELVSSLLCVIVFRATWCNRHWLESEDRRTVDRECCRKALPLWFVLHDGSGQSLYSPV